MNSIASVVAVICVSALGCSLVSVVAPQGMTRKVLNTVFGVFILCAMLVPVKEAITNFNVNISIAPESENLTADGEQAYNKAVMIETKAGLENTLISYLNNKKYAVLDADIELASYEDGGIYISDICIYISKENENHTQKIINLTQEKFEVKPEIVLR